MQKFNEDIQVNGRLSASILYGTLSDATVQPLVDEISAVRSANAELSEKLEVAQMQIDELVEKCNQMNDALPEKIDGAQMQIGEFTDSQSQINAELSEKLDGALSRIETLTQSYNNAIEVINDLAERVAALEANYDPTLIK